MVKTGYKQTEIGVLPEDWECVELNRLSDGGMQNGVFYEVNRKGAGVRIINVSDLYKKSPIEFDVLEKFNATDTEIQRFKVKSGDLFFTRSSVVPSGIAYCNWYNENESSIALFDSHVVRFKTDTCSVVPMYLYLQCVSQKSRKYFISVAKTAIMTTIDQSLIGKCLIPLPPKPEQEAIATALSDIDALIDNLEKLIVKKKAIKQGAMQELLTGKRRLPGFTGEWKKESFSEIYDFAKEGGTPSTSNEQFYRDGSIPFAKIDDLYEKYVESCSTFITPIGLEHSSAWLIPSNSLLLSNGATIGLVSINSIPLATKQGIIGIIPKKEYDIEFLYYVFSSNMFYEKLKNITTHGTMDFAYIKDVNQIVVEIPSDVQEQKAIASVLSDIDIEIEQLEKNLSKYKNIKSGMMSELLTGRIRLV